jgi:AraC-like DNA-binding protein
MHTEASISQLAYDQGFGSISNFNKTFKRDERGLPRHLFQGEKVHGKTARSWTMSAF